MSGSILLDYTPGTRLNFVGQLAGPVSKGIRLSLFSWESQTEPNLQRLRIQTHVVNTNGSAISHGETVSKSFYLLMKLGISSPLGP